MDLDCGRRYADFRYAAYNDDARWMMEWSGCELVEVIPGKVSGAPLVRGTRVPADAILSNFRAGSSVEEIAENYPSVSVETIRGLLSFARFGAMSNAS